MQLLKMCFMDENSFIIHQINNITKEITLYLTYLLCSTIYERTYLACKNIQSTNDNLIYIYVLLRSRYHLYDEHSIITFEIWNQPRVVLSRLVIQLIQRFQHYARMFASEIILHSHKRYKSSVA